LRFNGVPKEIHKEIPPELYEVKDELKSARFFLPLLRRRNCHD